jgi:hypothetical protein
MPSLLLASCCSVLVVNGADGLRVPGVVVVLLTVYSAPINDSKNF